MGWARLDDRRHTNGKLLACGLDDAMKGLAANGLDANALTYCSAQETDGWLEDAALIIVGPGLTPKQRADLTGRLVKVGRWSRDDEKGGWWVHDFLEYNPSRSKREKDREAAKQRQAKSRASGANNVGHDEDNGRFTSPSHATVTPLSRRDEPVTACEQVRESPLSRPVPSPKSKPKSPNNLESVSPENGGEDAPHPDENGKLRDLVTRLSDACTATNRQTVHREAALVIGLCHQHTPLELLDRAVTIITPKQPVLPRFLLREVEMQRRLAGLPAVTLSVDSLVKRVPA